MNIFIIYWKHRLIFWVDCVHLFQHPIHHTELTTKLNNGTIFNNVLQIHIHWKAVVKAKTAPVVIYMSQLYHTMGDTLPDSTLFFTKFLFTLSPLHFHPLYTDWNHVSERTALRLLSVVLKIAIYWKQTGTHLFQ